MPDLTAAALERMRMRLLDLSTNNRLLNYRFPKRRALRVIDTPPNPLFERIYIDGKTVSIVPIPDPPLELYEDVAGIPRKPDVREYARYLDIDPSYEVATHTRRENLADVQSLHYPEDLEAILRKLDQAARTAVEESGTNMLYLVFGYLGWYESPDSDKEMLAPLFILPVSLKRTGVDHLSGYFQYSLEFTGDDLTENITLREKMRQAFGLELPSLEDGDTPEEYFVKITEFAQPRPRWRVDREITLCLLSFGKLLMYLDLDRGRWPSCLPLDRHPVVSALFEGTERDSQDDFAEEYEIDENPEADSIPIVYDADSSQHTALIDAVKGKNLVIEGPPGTGKSQTITNLIAASLTKGKTALFVSEKLAALEVVRRRLDNAQFGDFCLELHSHKTQKRKLLDEINARLNLTFAEPRDLDRKIADLESIKSRLNRYALLINSVAGNQLGLKIQQLLWAADRYRTDLGGKAALLAPFEISNAPNVGPKEQARLEEAIDQLRRHLIAIGQYGALNPWWGYFPDRLLFGDDEAVAMFLRQLSDAAADLSSYLANGEQQLSISLPKPESESRSLCSKLLDRFPLFSGEEAFDLLPSILSVDSVRTCREFERTVHFIKDSQPRIQARLRNPDMIENITVGKVQSLLGVAKRLNQARVPSSLIFQRAVAMKEIISQTEAAVDLLLKSGETCGVSAEPTPRGLLLIHSVIRVAERAPLELLHFRTPRLGEPGVLESIRDARRLSEALRAKRSELQRLFALNTLPPKETITFAARTFVTNGSIFRLFQRDWWRAKRIYRSIRLKRPRLLKLAQCGRELGELLDFVESCERLNANPELRDIAGSLFEGIDTDFAKLERIAEWYRQALSELCPQMAPSEINQPEKLLQLPARIFEWLKAKASAGESAWVAIQGIQDRIESLFQTDDMPPGLKFGMDCSLGALTKTLAAAVAQMEEVAQYIETICVTDESPASAVEILNLLLAMRASRRELEQNQELRDVLGPRYKGLTTDFAPILSAYEWGVAVKALGLPRDIEEWVLTPKSRERAISLNAFAHTVAAKWQRISELRSELERFGTLDWCEWHRNGIITPDLIRDRADEALRSLDSLIEWAKLSRTIQNATALGLNQLCDSALKGMITPEELPAAFRYCFYSSLAKRVFRGNPELMQFSGLLHGIYLAR